MVGCCGPSRKGSHARTRRPRRTALLEMASKRLAETPAVHFALDVQGETFVDTANIRLLGAEGDLQRPDRVRTAFRPR